METEEFIRFSQNCLRVQGLTEEEKYNEYLLYKVGEYKRELASTDYEAIKYGEGVISEEEYQPIKAYREELRKKIRNIIDKGDEDETMD